MGCAVARPLLLPPGMPIEVHQKQNPESPPELALALSDALLSQGQRPLARAVLELLEPGERDERLLTRLADDALERGDAPRALRLLARAWEGGSLSPYVEARLALAALAVGLTDVTEALTEAPARSTEHAIVRLIHGAARGEAVELRGIGSPTELVFALRSQLRLLAACGRQDLVHAVAGAPIGLPGLASALAGLPRAPAASHELVRVPIAEARATFACAWGGGGGIAAANWAWAVAREVGQGERVLVLSPWPRALGGLLSHGTVVAGGPTGAPGAAFTAEPERLPVAAGRFDHVVAADWLGLALNPDAAMKELARVLAHEGQLHLLCAGPAAPGRALITYAPAALTRLAERAGLSDAKAIARQASGLPAEGAAAEIALMRAVRRLA